MVDTDSISPNAVGADIVGLKCEFDPDMCLEGLRLMKDSLDKAGLNPI